MASSQFPSAPLGFTTVAVSGQSDLVADAAADTLTVAAGTNITLTTNAGTDTLTIAASGGSPTIGDTQVAFGDGANTIGGVAGLTFTKAVATGLLKASGAGAGNFDGGTALLNLNTAAGEYALVFSDDGGAPGAFSAISASNGLDIEVDETGDDAHLQYSTTFHAWRVRNAPFSLVGAAAALQTSTIDAHTVLIQAYDVDGTAYKTFATLTNGNTPDLTIAPPSGGTVTVQASTFKSSDASTGITQDVTTGTLVGMTMVFKNGLLVDFHA